MVQVIVVCMLFQFLVFKINQETKSSLKTTGFMKQPSDRKENKYQEKELTKTPTF